MVGAPIDGTRTVPEPLLLSTQYEIESPGPHTGVPLQPAGSVASGVTLPAKSATFGILSVPTYATYLRSGAIASDPN